MMGAIMNVTMTASINDQSIVPATAGDTEAYPMNTDIGMEMSENSEISGMPAIFFLANSGASSKMSFLRHGKITPAMPTMTIAIHQASIL